MSVCIPTYMLASGLIAGGMSWWQADRHHPARQPDRARPHAAQRARGHQVRHPLSRCFVRASFGVRGANVPAVLRALVACGWFGIQTWIGGQAIHAMLQIVWPAMAELERRACGSASSPSGPSTCA